jgi:hypothetical protein
MGAPEEVIAKFKEDAKPESFDVFPEHWDAFEIFARMTTQWSVAEGAFVGLNYQSLDLLFKLYKIRDRRQAFEDIQVMEAAALKILNKPKGS